jgi:hypothetical protein
MTRVSRKACLGVLLGVGILAYVGCSGSAPVSGPGAAPSSSSSAAGASGGGEQAKPGKLLANWPTPQAVLVVTGQRDGYLEPCGCTQGQLGGLIRLLDFVDGLKAQNWPCSLVDLGTLILDPAAARGGFEQAKIKFGIALKAYSTLKYDAIALSAEDLKVGIGEALAQFLNNLGDTTKIVVANVQPAPGFESRIQASQIVADGPLKLGVTAVIDPALLEKLTDPDKGDWLRSIKRPDEVLGKVLSELEPKSDYQVLMVQGSPDLAKRLATAYPGFDVVVATSESADPLERDPVLLNGGKTMLINVGRRGKRVGVVGFFAEAAQKMRFYLVDLNSRNERSNSPMKKVMEDEFRTVLKGAGVVETFPRHDYTGGTAGATYVGAETCKRCHPNTFMQWASSKHSHAYDSLVSDPRPNTIYDAECVTCHTTGFEYTSGFRSAAATPHLKGTQCESCHGPGSKHAANPDSLDFRKPIRVTAVQSDKSLLCNRCHDEDNSPKFEFSTYWSQVRHNGLDDYTNPKVHQGVSPKVARKADGATEK